MENEPEVIELDYESILQETEKAYKVDFVIYVNGEKKKASLWLPKSQTEFKSGNMNVLIIPVWLYDAKWNELCDNYGTEEVELLEHVQKPPGG